MGLHSSDTKSPEWTTCPHPSSTMKQAGGTSSVWYELHENMQPAIDREKRMKGWKRKWKLEMIESMNPNWQDLYHTIV